MSKLISVNNSKLAKSGKNRGLKFVSFGLPAAQTCPGANKCLRGCYALSGSYLFRQVKESRHHNYLASLQDNFTSQIYTELLNIDKKLTDTILVVRIHDSGDFYSAEYLAKWIEVAAALPHVIFYAYTKSVHITKGVVLPDNFRLIYSLGGKYDTLVERDKMPHARVFESVEDLIDAGYTNASDDDALAIFGGLKIGLVFHHAKNYNNTSWSEVA